jgi:DNA polymerase (family 10)
MLGNLVKITYGKRTEMFLGVIKIDDFNAHRIDILIIESENWYPALLHFTGSKFFNIRLRSSAKSKGMKLSQHGLFDVATGEKYPIRSEEDIFRILEQSYLPPSHRV